MRWGFKERLDWIAENWSSHGFPRRRVVAAITLSMLVIAYDFFALLSYEPEWFQRLGSLFVAFSIVLVPYIKSWSEFHFESGHEQQEIGVANHLAHANFAAGWFMERVVFFYAVVFAAIGTLQWGYGDVFHCWVNGNGWRPCG